MLLNSHAVLVIKEARIYKNSSLIKYACSCRSLTSRGDGGRKVSKRGRKSLQMNPKTPRSAKDQIRYLQETNLVPKKQSRTMVRQADELFSLAESRLTWLRNKLYENWNPDYGRQQQQQRLQASAHSSIDNVPKLRPDRVGPEMDARWWFWNVCFALLPATGLALYCEFRGDYLMEDHHRRLDLLQMEEVMGREYTNEYRRQLEPIKQHVLIETVLAWYRQAVGWFINSSIISATADDTKPLNDTRADDGERSRQHSSTLQSSHTFVAEKVDASPTNIAKRVDSEKSSGGSTEVSPTIDSLLARIEELEVAIKNQRRDFRQEDAASLSQQLHQSRIRSRADQRKIKEWQEKKQEMDGGTSSETVEGENNRGNDDDYFESLALIVRSIEIGAKRISSMIRNELGRGDATKEEPVLATPKDTPQRAVVTEETVSVNKPEERSWWKVW